MHHLLCLMLLVKTSKLTQDYGSTDIDSAGMQELFLVCRFSIRLPIPVELDCQASVGRFSLALYHKGICFGSREKLIP